MTSFPPEVAKRINDIAEKNGGRITAEMVVADAKKKSSPLHNLFDWDLETAAMNYWIERARTIIRSVKVEIRTTSTSINAVAYVRDPRCGNREQGYTSLQQAAKSPEDSAGVMAYELGRAEASLVRCLEIAKALNMEGEAQAALSKVVGLRKKVDKRRGVHRSAAVANA